MAARWPQLDELPSSARSLQTSYHDQRKHAVSSLVVCARAEMAEALLAQPNRGQGIALADEVSLAVAAL